MLMNFEMSLVLSLVVQVYILLAEILKILV